MKKLLLTGLTALSLLLCQDSLGNKSDSIESIIKVKKGDSFSVEYLEKKYNTRIISITYWRYPECNETGEFELGKGERLIIATHSYWEGFRLEQFADFNCDDKVDKYTVLPFEEAKKMGLTKKDNKSIYKIADELYKGNKELIFQLFDNNELKEWLESKNEFKEEIKRGNVLILK